jgi:hypothetical protein
VKNPRPFLAESAKALPTLVGKYSVYFNRLRTIKVINRFFQDSATNDDAGELARPKKDKQLFEI